MCQSVAEGGKRCPAHRYDTRAIIKRAVNSQNKGGYSPTLYHGLFVDLRRAYRGTEMDDHQYSVASEAIGTVLSDMTPRDAHPVDHATLQAQLKLMSLSQLISDETEAKIFSHLGSGAPEDHTAIIGPRQIFSYVSDHLSEFPTPSHQELLDAKRDLGDVPLSRVKNAVTAYAVIRAGHIFDELPRTEETPDGGGEPRITELTPVTQQTGSPIVSFGYASATLTQASRLEIELRDDFNTRLAYQNVSREQALLIQQGGYHARDAFTDIRMNPHTNYQSKEESDAAGQVHSQGEGTKHCASCGQFTGGEIHTCPTRTIKQDLFLDTRAYFYKYSFDTESAIEHTDADGTPWGTSNITVPSLPTFSSLPLPQSPEEMIPPSLDEMLALGGTVPLDLHGINLSEVIIKTPQQIDYQILDTFRAHGKIPAYLDDPANDQIIYRKTVTADDANLYAFIAYLPSADGVTAFHTDEGIFIQHTGKEYKHFETYTQVQSEGKVLGYYNSNYDSIPISSLFPSTYDLSSGYNPHEPSAFEVGTEDQWRLPDKEALIEAFALNASNTVSFKHTVTVDPRGRFIDQEGYRYDPVDDIDEATTLLERTVRVSLTLEQAPNGQIKVLGVDTVSCSTCDKWGCSHAGYSIRQVPYVIQNLIGSQVQVGAIDEDTTLPRSLATTSHLTKDAETGTQTITFKTAEYEPTRYYGRFQDDADDEMERENYFNSTSSAPHPTQIARALKHISPGDSVVVPIKTTFTELNTNAFGHTTVKLTGTITYGKDDEGNSIVKERKLKCNCDVYERNYSCRHTRRIEERETGLLEPLMPQNTYARAPETDEMRDQRQGMLIQDRAEALREPIPNIEEATAIARTEANMSYAELSLIEDQYNSVIEQDRMEKRRLQELENQAAYAEQREKMRTRFENFEGPRYSEDYDAYQADVKEIRKKIRNGENPLEYLTTNVLNGIGDDDEHARKFGVELEAVFEWDEDVTDNHAYQSQQKAKIAEALYAAGLSSSDEVEVYHSGKQSNWSKWSTEEDATVAIEVVSPLLKDTPEDWAQLQQVCDIMREHGATVNTSTGSHVHISTGDYGSSVSSHAALLDEFSRYADIIYRLGSNPETKSHRGTEWCPPNVLSDEKVVSSGHAQSRNIATYLKAPHQSAVNFEASGNGKKSHAEIRVFDGSISPQHIQMQVMLTAAMTEVAAQRINQSELDSFSYSPKSEQMPLGTGLVTEFNSKEAETAKFREMLDRYFPKHEHRKAFIALWETSQWQVNLQEEEDSYNDDWEPYY